MRYNFKQVVMPEGMKIGSTIYISGEGDEEFTVTDIIKDETGRVTEVCNSSGWREPLSKIWLCKPGQDFYSSHADKTNWIQVAVGECDYCTKTFPDSCVYHTDRQVEGSMICQECWDKQKAKGKKMFRT